MGFDPRQILLAVEHLRPGVQLWKDFDLVDHGDGTGAFISFWNRDDLVEPTMEEIESVDTDAIVSAQAAFRARDLLAELTAADYAQIQDAIRADPPLGLLWASLLAQGEAPISVSADRFVRGWAGLSAAIGAERASAIARAIGLPV